MAELEGNYTINEMTVLEDIGDIGLIQILPLLVQFSLSNDFTILEISRKTKYLEVNRKW